VKDDLHKKGCVYSTGGTSRGCATPQPLQPARLSHLGGLKICQVARSFRPFTQSHQLGQVTKEGDEHPKLDELVLRDLDLEEVVCPRNNL
jgi:hypothetical protein